LREIVLSVDFPFPERFKETQAFFGFAIYRIRLETTVLQLFL